MEKALREIINVRYEKLLSRLVYRLRRVSAKDWAGDDSAMQNLWDHWKWEMREEHSIFHDLIEDMVEQQARFLVDNLPHDEGALLTMMVDSSGDDEVDEDVGAVFYPDGVTAELMSRLNERAMDEPHRASVQWQLEDVSRDRYERDMEPYY